MEAVERSLVPPWADVVLAAATLVAVAWWGWGHLDVLGWVVAGLCSVALCFRRRFPVAVAVVTLAACVVYYPASEVDAVVWPALVIALYTVAANAQLVTVVVLTAVALLAFAFLGHGHEMPNLDLAAPFLLAGWFVAAGAVGAVVYNRRAYLREVLERRDEEFRSQAAEERLRIARELHDVLGHNISLINVQASATLHRLADRPEAAEAALVAIKDASKEALRELRTTLGLLRQADELAPVAPAPDLDRVAELAEVARATGLAVTVRIEGDPRPVPPEVGLAGFRIVQESLTNVTRHAAASAVVITLRYGAEDVGVVVDDDGRGDVGRARGQGSGLHGMAERAKALGGDLVAAGGPDGGFRVTARLPLERG
ncbi:sensor histidine kinase [Umezawaea sp. NPDC059074]|uniref:sensor histidine kinase n=1 Tax=Umezawaea sp. NPDC059074 TaxID=3346716 RepID=UPI003689B81D